MDNRFTASLVGLIAVFALGLFFGGNYALAQVPADFSYEAKPQNPVTFSHKVHVTEKKLQCPACHMNPKLFDMKKGGAKFKMADINEGKYCGSCHDGKKAFSAKDPKNWATCHKKK